MPAGIRTKSECIPNAHLAGDDKTSLCALTERPDHRGRLALHKKTKRKPVTTGSLASCRRPPGKQCRILACTEAELPVPPPASQARCPLQRMAQSPGQSLHVDAGIVYTLRRLGDPCPRVSAGSATTPCLSQDIFGHVRSRTGRRGGPPHGPCIGPIHVLPASRDAQTLLSTLVFA